ncbi:CsiV family protein [Kangiella sp. TOML190]|uniref:CsiV family protein n=1 Tax=Kangiella sp. TOML190 TaxID=2931351 RepID=UPI00203BB765|nr:CsiV family protein [Kangiella sp. TOML190]
MTKIKALTISITLAALLLLTALPVAKAQTIFNVELVLFKRLDATGQFNYLAKEQLSDYNLELEQEYSLVNPVLLPDGFSPLKRQEHRMEGVYNRLKSSANMRPLLHLAWRQPLNDKEQTPWLFFSVGDDPEKKGLQEFMGNIRFSRNEGLLVESSVLGFKAADPNILTEGDMLEGNSSQAPEALAGYFMLSENRKIKINKLNYFDHPTMGLLLKVTPYQASLAEQDALEAE